MVKMSEVFINCRGQKRALFLEGSLMEYNVRSMQVSVQVTSIPNYKIPQLYGLPSSKVVEIDRNLPKSPNCLKGVH